MTVRPGPVEIKQRSTERIEELTARRDQPERLAHGDRAPLPDRACALLERAAEVGLPPEALAVAVARPTVRAWC